jgi:hypothetical protein
MKRRDHLRDIGVDGRIVLKWVLRKHRDNMWIGLLWLRAGSNDLFL